MCEGTVLPHCAHLFSCGACQRLAALRVRNRIFEVLRLGTPIVRATKAPLFRKTSGCASDSLEKLQRYKGQQTERFTL